MLAQSLPWRARIRSFSHTASLSISICLRHTLLYGWIFLFFLSFLLSFFLSFDADVAKITSPLPYLTPWGQNASIVASLGPFRSSPRVFLSRTVPFRPMVNASNSSHRICGLHPTILLKSVSFLFFLSRMLLHQSICHAVDRCHAGARINSPVRQHAHTLDIPGFFSCMRAVDPTCMCASHTLSLVPPSSKQ